jgi:hypothetical protein
MSVPSWSRIAMWPHHRPAARKAALLWTAAGSWKETQRDRPDGLIWAAPSSRLTAAGNPIAL